MSELFLFVTNDGFDFNDRRISAYSILEKRLNDNSFPIYKRTRHKSEIQPKSIVYFYLAGHKQDAGNICYRAIVKNVRAPSTDELEAEELFGDIEYICDLEKIEKIKKIKLRDILISKKLIDPNNKKWGAYLMGGVKKLPVNFFDEYVKKDA